MPLSSKDIERYELLIALYKTGEHKALLQFIRIWGWRDLSEKSPEEIALHAQAVLDAAKG